MAANFDKKEALAMIADIKGVAAQKFQYSDLQLKYIIKFYKTRSYRYAYGYKLPVKDISAGSVTYMFNGGKMGPAKKKSTIGIGTGKIDKESTGFVTKTAYMSEPLVRTSAFYAADLYDGMEQAVAIKYSQANDSFELEKEVEFLKRLATLIPNPSSSKAPVLIKNVKSINTGDEAKDASNKIADGAFDMSELENSRFNINGINESEIMIDLSSRLFNRLVDERLIVDAADVTFGKGIFRIGEMRGFKVRRNEFLGKPNIVSKYWDNGLKNNGVVHGIIFTGYTAASPDKLIVSKAGDVDNLSEDKGYYIEQAVASENGVDAHYCILGADPLLKLIVGT